MFFYSNVDKKCISKGITLHTVVGHFQLWGNYFVDLDMLNIFAV
jgi:hypothetical protein